MLVLVLVNTSSLSDVYFRSNTLTQKKKGIHIHASSVPEDIKYKKC